MHRASRLIQINKDVKGFLAEAINSLVPHTLDGKVTTINNRGHLKIKGKFPAGNHSFVMGSSPSDWRWMLKARSNLKRFIAQIS
jgi:hypothetical protein